MLTYRSTQKDIVFKVQFHKYDGTEGNIASKRMFHEAGVKLVQLPYEIDVETKISER